jgi:hypothetical protein
MAITTSKRLVAQRQVIAKITPTSGVGQTVAGAITNYFATALDGQGTPAGYLFTQVSGGEITASVEKVYMGGKMFPETLCAPAEIGDITLTGYVMYESADQLHIKCMQELRQVVGRTYFDITISISNSDLLVPGSDRFYSKALLVGMTEADGDASSGTPATYSLTFSIASVAVPS